MELWCSLTDVPTTSGRLPRAATVLAGEIDPGAVRPESLRRDGWIVDRRDAHVLSAAFPAARGVGDARPLLKAAAPALALVDGRCTLTKRYLPRRRIHHAHQREQHVEPALVD